MISTATSPPPSLTTTTASTTTAASPASPTRPSRLRGLSYLRNYTQNHLHSRESSTSSTGSSRPFTLIRATSYPSPTSTPTGTCAGADTTPTPRSPDIIAPPPPPVSSQDSTTGGWLPTGPQGAISRITSDPQPVTASIPADATATMARTRSATTSGVALDEDTSRDAHSSSVPATSVSSLPSIRFTQHQDVRAPRPSLMFTPMQRTLPTGKEVIRVGRYSEREAIPNQPYNVPSFAPVGFKSKVVSRRHCEFWSSEGTWYIKDVKSSSGTFLNHVRLSSPGQESKPFAVKDGDIVQLGIDFKGGEEMIFRCVKIRVELNRNWQNSLNSFNVASHRRLRNMAKQNASVPGASSSQDCSICLGPVAPCQALFVAPCSHTWHYKCVRRILNGPSWPQFVCPNCRAVADLEAEVDEPYDDGDWEEVEAGSDNPSVPVKKSAPQVNESSEEELLLEEEEGQSRVPARHPETNTDESEDDATGLEAPLQGLDLKSTASTPMQIPASRNGSLSQQRIVDQQQTDDPRTPSPVPQRGRNGPPGIVDLSSGSEVVVEGPMTPRNDVGPFVFDGSAGRLGGPA